MSNRGLLQKKISSYSRVQILGLDFLDVTESECIDLVINIATRGLGGWLLTPNLDILRQSHQNPEIFEICQNADIRVADGMPLIWASRLQKTPLPERVSGSNIIMPIMESAAKNEIKIFLLGGAPGVVEVTRENLVRKIPNLLITGTYCPPFGFEEEKAELSAISSVVKAARPHIVFVALSFPKGERLIEILKEEIPGILWIGVGISFSFISGDVKRAPAWMQGLGIEWIYRLIQEPSRLFRRYLINDLPFAFHLFLSAIRNRAK